VLEHPVVEDLCAAFEVSTEQQQNMESRRRKTKTLPPAVFNMVPSYNLPSPQKLDFEVAEAEQVIESSGGSNELGVADESHTDSILDNTMPDDVNKLNSLNKRLQDEANWLTNGNTNQNQKLLSVIPAESETPPGKKLEQLD